MKSTFISALLLVVSLGANGQNYVSKVWVADQGNGTYKNPILYADYSDPDVCKAGSDYYMTSSSFNCLPGLQILHSKDLVNWEIINAAIPTALDPITDTNPQHGNRVWAPSIRFHNGEFYIFWGDPDQGVFMTHTSDPAGRWSKPVLVKAAKGIIDTTPLWDEDGRVYLVHALAGSRAGLKSVIAICELNDKADSAITASRIIFDGHEGNPTCEGPKLYKKDGYYYIFLPAGGVTLGWQLVLRSKNIYGPYESKTVMSQGKTKINGPHQGGWVTTDKGEDWFINFQDKGAYGRVTHLQPMKWVNGWPVIGIDKDGDGCGEPVTSYKKPNVGANYSICTPKESDEFNSNDMGEQWQWHGNIDEKWAFWDASRGVARLYSFPVPKNYKNLWDISNLLLQKTPAPNFTATTKVTFTPTTKYKGERTGLVVMGMNYGTLALENREDGIYLSQISCINADKGEKEKENASVKIENGKPVYLRVNFKSEGEKVMCNFSYSLDNKKFNKFGVPFQAREGLWIGAKVGIFCTRPSKTINDGGWSDFDWFRIDE